MRQFRNGIKLVMVGVVAMALAACGSSDGGAAAPAAPVNNCSEMGPDGTKCTFTRACVINSSTGSGYYESNLGKYPFSSSAGIQAAANALVTACQ